VSQSWALLQIGEIAVLDEWKQRYKKAGNLDVVELVDCVTAIKDSLDAHITRLESVVLVFPKGVSNLLDVFTQDISQPSRLHATQSSSVTRFWAHAALLYLFIILSGQQPTSVNMRYHVGRIVELLTHEISLPALLRTMVWPFCMAGCLAEREQLFSLKYSYSPKPLGRASRVGKADPEHRSLPAHA